jgi:hypothetical protein
VKYRLLLATFASLVAGCSPNAPVMKRVLQDEPIDRRYLHEVFIPAHASQEQLLRSVALLETHVAEFQSFMRDVEIGKIAVKQGFKGNWGSFVQNPDAWISAEYSGRTGPVIDFQKHQNKNPAPMIFDFEFNTSGYITRVDMPDDGFNFDYMGRAQSWHGPK